MFFPTTDGNVVENFILNDIILFLFYFIIYLVIPMMLLVNMLLMSYVVIEPHCILADGTANFIIYLTITLLLLMLLSLGQMLLKMILFIVIVVHDVIMEPCGQQRVSFTCT